MVFDPLQDVKSVTPYKKNKKIKKNKKKIKKNNKKIKKKLR